MSSFITAILLLWAAASPGTGAAAQDAHVTIALKAPAAITAGSSGTIQILFRPKKGIHINADPAIEVAPEANPVIASVTAITPSKNSKGYVDASKPVKASASVAASAPKGVHTVKMKVTYFLCSDAEGWCNRGEQTVDMRVTVK